MSGQSVQVSVGTELSFPQRATALGGRRLGSVLFVWSITFQVLLTLGSSLMAQNPSLELDISIFQCSNYLSHHLTIFLAKFRIVCIYLRSIQLIYIPTNCQTCTPTPTAQHFRLLLQKSPSHMYGMFVCWARCYLDQQMDFVKIS